MGERCEIYIEVLVSGVAMSQTTPGHCTLVSRGGGGGLTKAAGLESEVVLTHDFSIRARSAGLQVLRWNATMYREAGARRRV